MWYKEATLQVARFEQTVRAKALLGSVKWAKTDKNLCNEGAARERPRVGDENV